jgi:hypothetical protein
MTHDVRLRGTESFNRSCVQVSQGTRQDNCMNECMMLMMHGLHGVYIPYTVSYHHLSPFTIDHPSIEHHHD